MPRMRSPAQTIGSSRFACSANQILKGTSSDIELKISGKVKSLYISFSSALPIALLFLKNKSFY